MVNRLTRTVRQSYFSRIASSFLGIFVGVLFVPGSVCLMSWNEYRTVHRARGLIEAEDVVAEVADPLQILGDMDQRLVHVTGQATTEEVLSDDEFPIARLALRLERQTEMYQWVEHEESKTRDKVGGGRETIKTYTYRQQWRSGLENSTSFEQPEGHENPQPRYNSKSLTAQHAQLGAFQFRPELVNQIDSWQNIALDETSILEKLEPSRREHFRFEPERFYYSASSPPMSEPQVGDMRIQFRVVEPKVVSVLAKQQNQSLEPFTTSNGETIESVQVGHVTTTAMFESLRRQNSFIAIIVRLVGWFMACLGCVLIIAPLKNIASFVPLFGRLVGIATFGIAFLLGSVITLVTIAVAWILVRPIFGITLLAFACVGIFVLSRRWHRAKPTASPRSSSVPPPLPSP